MEKCEFCSRMVLFGKKDVSNLLGARPVVLGEGEPVYYTLEYRITAVKKT